MTTLTESDVRATLNEIVDPCSITAGVPAGLVDMGLVGDIRIDDAPNGCHRIAVTVGVTEPSCVLIGSFANEAHARLSALPGVTAVEVALSEEVDWSEDKMAPEYRQRLTEHRAQARRTLPLLAAIATGRAGEQ
ncbi:MULTISPECIES: metal-sulfur cluster assembly factor [unclassified Streptomyces]|uniref:metal-sulfur cluster assembly factor n=1 Tax=unclassified Streptomyces TaxID=2593676 RepID=UPI00224F584D|nr:MULTISPECIES: iron-sulfur cluster assembly protein [unclassified Streptomyces]MCX4641965.1 iron-sulfur cluster assembly protein [Streptomyces sp. NBC_01446]MCX5085700.1 iron-sulfur cluster assembly protein [Streptomyces sp. NBC_00401]MCX5326839.1 iron-sulfur cluster assembly protein [Streptomyces sp. NBC_00120]